MAPRDSEAIGSFPASEAEIKDFEVLTSMSGLRALADPTRLQMIHILSRNPSTGSMLARALNIPANRAHYHLRRLLEAGLIQGVGAGRKRWTEERYFRASARHLLIDPGLTGAEDRPTIALRQSIDTTFLDWRRSQILAIDWGDLAHLIVQQSLRTKRDDRVMIHFAPIALELAEAIMVEIEACGAIPYPRPWSRNVVLRTLDRYSPEDLEQLPFIPPAIDRDLTASVVITSDLSQGPPPNAGQRVKLPRFLESLSRWNQSARQRGLRLLEVDLPHRAEFSQGYLTPEAGIDMFWRCATADLKEIRRRGEQLLRIVRSEAEFVIEGKNETCLQVALDPSHAIISDGLISEDDLRAGQSMDTVPAGSFSVLPVPGSGEGVFEADYTFSCGRHIRGVRVTIREGRIVSFDAANDADVIREQLARESGDPDMLSNITIGLNSAGRGPTGRPALDSLLAGVVTLEFGNNELRGGKVKSTLNLKLPAHGLTVRTRARTLVRQGRVTAQPGSDPARGDT